MTKEEGTQADARSLWNYVTTQHYQVVHDREVRVETDIQVLEESFLDEKEHQDLCRPLLTTSVGSTSRSTLIQWAIWCV
jgi:hypothetical protein